VGVGERPLSPRGARLMGWAWVAMGTGFALIVANAILGWGRVGGLILTATLTIMEALMFVVMAVFLILSKRQHEKSESENDLDD
jgi:hypothetical protein